MSTHAFDPARSALLTVDLQNDFLHPDGAYGRGRATLWNADALVGNVRLVAEAMRAKGGLFISTQFTLVPGRGGEPIISPHLKAMRPFLRKGDFLPGAWGHQLVAELGQADVVVEKVAYSAFYMTRMEFVLRKLGIDTLLVAGIVTNGGVASTLRDAHVRDLHATLLTDGCAAFSREAHEASLTSLGTVAPRLTCAEAAAMIAAS